MTQQADPAPIPDAISATSAWHKISLTVGSVICIAIALWLSRTLRVPAERFEAGIILQQSSWPIAMGLAWVLILGGAIVGAIITRGHEPQAGLFCAVAGLAALSTQFGPSRYALFASNGTGTYLLMAFELVLLYIPVLLAWLILNGLNHRETLPTESVILPAPLDQNLMAMATHGILTMILVTLFCQTDVKAQCFAAVGLASCLAAMGAHTIFTETPSIWFVASPLLVGLVGYIAQWLGSPNWMIGESSGLFGPLARPLPLDYASLATAGALLGYWTSLGWHHERLATGSGAA